MDSELFFNQGGVAEIRKRRWNSKHSVLKKRNEKTKKCKFCLLKRRTFDRNERSFKFKAEGKQR